MLPLGLNDPLRRQFRPDPGPLEAPIGAQAVLLFIERQICIPPLETRHDDLCQAAEKGELGVKIPALQNVLDISPHIDSLGWIVVVGKVSLKFGQPVRQIRGAQYDPVRPQMGVVPGERIIVQRISAVQILGGIHIEKMIHKKHIVHVLLVKDRQIVDFFFVRKQVSDGMKLLCPLTDFHNDKKL